MSPVAQGRWSYEQRYQAQLDLVFLSQEGAKLIDEAAGSSTFNGGVSQTL